VQDVGLEGLGGLPEGVGVAEGVGEGVRSPSGPGEEGVGGGGGVGVGDQANGVASLTEAPDEQIDDAFDAAVEGGGDGEFGVGGEEDSHGL